MLECFTFFNMVENLYGETFLPGNGKLAYTRSVNPNRRPYPTKDGYIGLVPYSDQQWEKFFEIGGMPGVFQDPRFSTYAARTENTGALYALIEQVTATRTTDEWLELMDKANIPAMRYNTLAEVLTDAHLTATGFFAESEHPEIGRYRTMRHPVRFAGSPASLDLPPPRPGADNETILESLGLGS
jgi:crotonobetainyl-CoA:carnitine CoA-transferase CaiB-like acyl-CoA transferase